LEKILEVLQDLTGITTDTIYDLLFTDKRIIAAIVLHHSDLRELYMKLNPLTVMLLGGSGTTRNAKVKSAMLIEKRRAAFKESTPDTILTMHRANIQIDYDKISSVRIKKGLLSSSLEFHIQAPREKKLKFSLKKKNIVEAKQVIDKMLPGKVELN